MVISNSSPAVGDVGLKPRGRTMTEEGRVEAVCRRVLLGPWLTLALSLFGLTELLTWLPHYLTWPYWADQDVFATAARAWTEGRLPYRDTFCNNFPGTTYLFWVLGETFGWGKAWPLRVFDAGLLLLVVALVVYWSRQRFGRALPGVVGALTLLSFYLSLDYCHVAQRDWHGPVLMVVAILAIQLSPSRATSVLSAVAAATAFSIRPQTVLFLPAVAAALVLARGGGETPRRPIVRLVEWGAIYALSVVAAFIPLMVAGVMGDFLRSLRMVAYGSRYNEVTLGLIVRVWVNQASSWRWWAVIAGIVTLAIPFRGRPAQASIPWLIAMAGVSFYKPLSPVLHSYLAIPILVVWTPVVACLVALILEEGAAHARLRLVGVLLVLGVGCETLRPKFCGIAPTVRAVKALARGSEPTGVPLGYRHGTVPTSAFYTWDNYRDLLDYLRESTRPSTSVANVLKGDPAVNSMVDRPSVFPAESIAWLRIVNPSDESRFVEDLERAKDSVVVWSPDEVGPDTKFTMPALVASIRRHYRPETRFGPIEVWRRVGE